MNQTVFTVKIDPKLKKKAMKVADDLGFNLSTLIKGYLKELVRNKEVNFSLEEIPNARTAQALREADAAHTRGEYYSFEDPQKAVQFLEDIRLKKIKI